MNYDKAFAGQPALPEQPMIAYGKLTCPYTGTVFSDALIIDGVINANPIRPKTIRNATIQNIVPMSEKDRMMLLIPKRQRPIPMPNCGGTLSASFPINGKIRTANKAPGRIRNPAAEGVYS